MFCHLTKRARSLSILSFLLVFAWTQQLNAQSITTVTPNTGKIGQQLNLLLSGTSLNFTSGTASIQTTFKKGTTNISAPCTSIGSGGAVPEVYLDLTNTSYPAGFYDLEVNSTDHGLLTLSNAFYIDTTRLLSTTPQKIYHPNTNVKVDIVGYQVNFNQVTANPYYFRNQDTIRTTLGTVRGTDTLGITVNINAPTIREGNYDLHVMTSGGPLILRNALQVLGTNISGTVYFDANQNNIMDPGELPISGVSIKLAGHRSAYTGTNGKYRFSNVGGGTFEVIRLPKSWANSLAPRDTQTVVVTSGNEFTANFGLTISNPYVQLYASVGRTRCFSLNNTYTIQLKNYRNQNSDGVYYFIKDPLINYSTNTISKADSIRGDTAFFSYSGLAPLATVNKTVDCDFPGVNTLGVGAIVKNKVHTYRVNGSGVKVAGTDYSTYVTSINRCSYDPNDKAATPPGFDSLGYVPYDTYKLEYKIRFQNTGNDTAYRVQILDTLSADLNWSTFQYLDASHNVITELDTNGIVTFTFDNIFLVDSATNEPASNGFVTFSIERDSSLADSTTVSNRAGIYFDFNPPIITNYAVNTFATFQPIWSYKNDTICDGQTYTFPNGNTSTVAAIDTSHYVLRTGHDSSSVINLLVDPSHNFMNQVNMCPGGVYTFPDGDTSSISHTDTSFFINQYGCDSLIETHLIVYPIYERTDSISLCPGQSYQIPGGPTVSTAGVHTWKYSTQNNCDSTVHFVLSYTPAFNQLKQASICNGETYVFPKGNTGTQSMVDSAMFKAQGGCDSLVVTFLNVIPTYNRVNQVTICSGTVYTFPDGDTSTVTRTDTSVFKNVLGCDSLIETQLVVNPSYELTQPVALCQGESFTIPGGPTLTSPGTHTWKYSTQNSCDSTVHFVLTYHAEFKQTKQASICKGETYVFPKGNTATQNAIDSALFQAKGGCDSLVITQLSVIPVDTSVLHSNGQLKAQDLSANQYQWIDCQTGQAVAGANSSSFMPDVNGSYALVVTRNGCTDTSACHKIGYVGIEGSIQSDGISLYPNPTSGKAILKIQSKEQELIGLTVRNPLGQVIIEMEEELIPGENQLEIPDEFSVSGIYQITVTRDGQQVSLMLAVEK
ncbi:hypothetical protein KFE98_17545 [bacterium SCSIO 12741]|nr:hypothetical protein KFE98_17545 [bacterium SCSIO 12741]